MSCPLIRVGMCVLFLSVWSLPAQGQDTAEQATDSLRVLYYARDYERGYAEGQKWVQEFPESAPLRAWWIVAMAASGKKKEAVDAARKRVREQEKDPWSWFALANALNGSSPKNTDSIRRM